MPDTRLSANDHCDDSARGVSPICYFTKTVAEANLLWEDWDNVFVVFQPSSAETHVFNETTASILRSLQQSPLSADALKERTEAALDVDLGGLAADHFVFATMRLEELGLIERLDDASAAR